MLLRVCDKRATCAVSMKHRNRRSCATGKHWQREQPQRWASKLHARRAARAASGRAGRAMHCYSLISKFEYINIVFQFLFISHIPELESRLSWHVARYVYTGSIRILDLVAMIR